MTNLSMKRNSLIRKWIRDHGNDGFASFNFAENQVKETKEGRKIKDPRSIRLTAPLVSFDFKREDLFLYEPLVYITEVTRSQRKRKRAFESKEMKATSVACAFWFGSLDETIDYLKQTRDFLKKLGYDTSASIGDWEDKKN